MNRSTFVGGEIALRTLASTGSCRERTIVESVRQFFGFDLARRIAIHRRLSCDAVETGIDLALPSILAALANLASRPLGAGILACSVARQYPTTLESIRNGIGSESQDVAAAYGWGYMEYLVGADAFSAACADIAGVSQIRDEEAKLLIGLVGWVLMSELRVEQRRLDLSASDLADLLRRSCGGDLKDACSSPAPIGTLLADRRPENAKPRAMRRGAGGLTCVIHAHTIGIQSRPHESKGPLASEQAIKRG
jgi:hypothetical protein